MKSLITMLCGLTFIGSASAATSDIGWYCKTDAELVARTKLEKEIGQEAQELVTETHYQENHNSFEDDGDIWVYFKYKNGQTYYKDGNDVIYLVTLALPTGNDDACIIREAHRLIPVSSGGEPWGGSF